MQFLALGHLRLNFQHVDLLYEIMIGTIHKLWLVYLTDDLELLLVSLHFP